MAPHPNPPSRNIIPSSGAIHTSNANNIRTFYYSSLIIDNGSTSKKRNSRWKLYIGDIVAVAKSSLSKSTQEVIESWKPNHYVNKSPDWKIGLVIALRKVITRHGDGRGIGGVKKREGVGVGGTINFECHVQWLQKSLDLDINDMKSAKLKTSYRPYNTNSTKTGSQLPHVLINCPGDFGIISMLSGSQSEEEYNIILPVTITMKTNRDFMKNGVKEGEESEYELQFCCTKTRRQVCLHKKRGEAPDIVPNGRNILNERDPDAWVQLNRPGAFENSNEMNANMVALLNKVPNPLQQAWKGWLQTKNSVDRDVDDTTPNASGPSNEEKIDLQERLSLLGDALMRGWSQSRRERYNKFILVREENRRKCLERDLKNAKGAEDGNAKKMSDTASKVAIENRTKANRSSKLKTSSIKAVSSTKRKLNAVNVNVKDESMNTEAKHSRNKRTKKELRFSADTKQPPSRPNSTSDASVTRIETNKRSSTNSVLQKERISAYRKAPEKRIILSEAREDPQRKKLKRGRQKRTERTNDDEAASTTTRDTHSTDTTLPTRGAGRRNRAKLVPNVGQLTNEKSANDGDFSDTGTKTPRTMMMESEEVILSTNGDGTILNVDDALNTWEIDSLFSEKEAAFYTTKDKCYYRELRMTMPFTDSVLRCLLDEDEIRLLNQDKDNSRQFFDIKVGSVVAVHYLDSKSTTNSWSPFRVPWGVAQVSEIFRERRVDEKIGAWRLTIKWFYRYPELSNDRRTKVIESMNLKDGLVETFESCDCSVKELLPAYIDLTSNVEEFARHPRQHQGKNRFPVVRMLCQHLERSLGKIKRQSDWTFNHQTVVKSSPSSLENTISGPLKRAINHLPARMKKVFNGQLESNSLQRDKKSQSSQNLSNRRFDIVPDTIVPPWKQGGVEYFDSVRLNADKLHLHTSFRSNANNRWAMAVGNVIAVKSDHTGRGMTEGNSRRWYPFQKQWRPAQIVALYKKGCETWMMEIKWFDRFEEILQQHKDGIDHLNKFYVVFETEVYEHVPVTAALPGRVILTSIDNKQSWEPIISDKTGLTLIPRLCNNTFFDEEIDTCLDWTNYDLELPQVPSSLSRGLQLQPKNRLNKDLIPILFQYYEKIIRNRGIDPDHDYLKEWRKRKKFGSENYESAWCQFEPDDCTVHTGPQLTTILLGRESQVFFRSVTVHSPITYLTEPAIGRKRKKENAFECMIGDIVCYFDKNASTTECCTSAHYTKHPWHPFKIPWSYGQILTIYKESNKSLKIELRRFYKLSEVSDEAKEFLSLQLEDNREEIFESNDIEIALDAKSVLGTVDLFLGDHKLSGTKNNSDGKRNHVASCRCKFFYMKTFEKLQPIYWSSLFAAGWHQGLQQRGYQRSSFVNKHEKLRELLLKRPDKGLICDLLPTNGDTQEEGCCVHVGKPIQVSQAQRSYYTVASTHPQWSLFCASDHFSLADSSERKEWILNIGDIVAIKDERSESMNSTFPFLIPWYPGQIVAIFNESHTNDLKSVHFEILRLTFEASGGNCRRKLTMCDSSKTDTLTSSFLLGPILIHRSDHTNYRTDLKRKQTHLPLFELMATDAVRTDTESVLALSKLYTTEEREKLLQLAPSGSKNSTIYMSASCEDTQMMPVYQPFRVDKLNLRAFYSEVSVVPHFKVFRGGMYEINSTRKTVRIGDVVRVRFQGPKRYPYDCNWGVAEVVAIFEEFGSKVEMDRRQQISNKEQKNFWKVEIRWFYERRDIAISIPSESEQSGSIEVFETDHCQVMQAYNAILDHVQLVENHDDTVKNGKDCFLCTRFWSTKRRSLVPCSGVEGRAKRGLLHSTLGLEHDIDGPPSLHNKEISLKTLSTNWRQSMSNLIRKLTLKDASKDVFANGDGLVGREREISQLLSFLRGAFSHDCKTASYKSSMFVAGPPGVGKTASVRAAVAKLRHEQKAGTIPNFRFISLNGIEVRHPFDIYIRFWELLTGRIHIGSHERACEWLESYFTSNSSDHELPDNCTTIVLLDEIDYLITSNQSVLYNLFDWPKRAAELSHGRRLIVIGVSNTLNLVDQLMPSVQSRVGTERCVFKAYSLNDTSSILKSKIREGSSDDAILFAARKTAALSGDIRKAFQLCRSAAQLVTQRFEQNPSNLSNSLLSYPKIRISDVQKASLESFNMAMVTAVSFAASYEALLLISLASLCRATGREIGGFDIRDIMVKMDSLANATGDPQYTPPPSFEETIQLLTRLGEMNLVELQTLKSSATTFRQSRGGSGGAWPMTSLAIDELTLLKGLKHTSHKELAQKNLPFTF